MIRVENTWPVDPVTMVLDEHPFILIEEPDKSKFIHGIAQKGQIPLTLKEAEDLVSKLSFVIYQIKEMEQQLEYIEEFHKEE